MRGGANNVGQKLSDEHIKKLSDRYFGNLKDFQEKYKEQGIVSSQFYVFIKSHGIVKDTITNILSSGKASKKVLEKLDFIFNK